MARTAEEIKGAVKEFYGERAVKASSCCGPEDAKDYKQKLYELDDIKGMPETVASFGCGNPTTIAGLKTGETVLDLGSGAGLDCFLSAKAVGETGKVIGLDMTDEMLALAKKNRAELGVKNVEFRKGEMESMPVDDETVDVIISNCVINLSPDKDAVFRESHRVLKPGGRFHVSDVLLSRELTEDETNDLSLWAGCASGALLEDDYLARMKAAGFAEARIDSRSKIVAPGGAPKPWFSATISAFKSEATPASATGDAPATACCGPTCCS